MDLLADLNEPQRQAVMHMDGPMLVLAGAGSGKTRVITRRVAWLVSQGVPPWNILALTFTNKAAGEMRQRVEQLGASRGAVICTFHALCVRLLREFADLAGLKPNFSIYDRDDQLRLVKQALEDLKITGFTPAVMHSRISTAKNRLQLDGKDTNDEPMAPAVAEAYVRYQELLAQCNALDFDDLLLRTATMLRGRQDLLRQLGQRFRYVMIDEYQDTNHAQYVLAHGIAMEHVNLAATGDPDQSIYGWRGADINNILEFERDYPEAKVIRLEENYRSTAPILAAASRLIAHNRQRKEKKLWTRRDGGAKVRVVQCDDAVREAEIVAQGIAAWHKAGGSYEDVAIFYRVNSLSRILEDALMRATIPYRVARGVEFYNRKEVKDLHAYLRLLVNPADDLSCARVINTPPRGIGQTTMTRLVEYALVERISLLEACRRGPAAGLSAAIGAKVAAFASLIDDLAGRADGDVRTIMEDVISTSGYERTFAGDDEESRQSRSVVDELISAAADYDSRRAAGQIEASEGGTALADYLHHVGLISDIDHMDGGNGAVTLMTLHAAKGLEFPAVFIIGWEQGLLPYQREPNSPFVQRSDHDRQIEEERRLAFVGITRAMRQLTLTCARMRRIRGLQEVQIASPFLGEIGREHVVVEDATTAPAQPAARSGGGYYEETRQRRVIEAHADRQMSPIDEERALARASADPAPPEYEWLRVGSWVRSPKFGVGKIVSASGPWPDTRVKVEFKNHGPKTLVLAMAKLETV